MSLKNDKYLILKQLFRNPVMPYSTLAKRVGLSPPTVKKRVDYLMRKGFSWDLIEQFINDESSK